LSAPDSLSGYFVGIDWATESHRVCLLIGDARRGVQTDVEHSVEGYARLISWLRRQTGDDVSAIAVAIETPIHPVVDALLDADITVFSLNPRQLDRFRDRHSHAGAKDDARDAFVLAHSLRTDLELFRPIAPLDPVAASLREAFRGYVSLREDLRRQANRLRETLLRFAPNLLALGVDEPFLWDLLDLGLDPDRARTLRIARVQSILRRHRKRVVTAEAALRAIRSPRLTLRRGVAEGLVLNAAQLTALLRVTRSALVQAERRLRTLLPEAGFDAEAVDSLPGAGVVVTAAFVAEANDPLRRRDLQGLRTLCGTAPVTRRSGRSWATSYRKACNRYLRDACWDMARSAVLHDPWARRLYADMRHRGLEHNRALRGVADRLLTRLVALLKTGTLYDPEHFRTRSQAAAVA